MTNSNTVNWLSESDLSDLLGSLRDPDRNSVGVAGEIGLGVSDMLRVVRDQVGSDRRVRLFACACLRRVWDLLVVEGARRIVELAEGYADGEQSEAELQAATTHASFDGVEDRYYGLAEPRLSIRTGEAITAAQWLASPTFNTNDAAAIASRTSKDATRDYYREPEWDGRPDGIAPSATERADQVRLLLDIFGNPSCPITLDPTWVTPQVKTLAKAAYDDRTLPTGRLRPACLAVLSDALEECGCTDTTILAHLRGRETHVRGCWAVDLILGRS